MAKANAFAKFSQQKESEQERVEAELTGNSVTRIGRPRKRKDATPVNILLALEDKQKLMELAECECLGMNDLVTRWIRENYRLWQKQTLHQS